MISSVTFAQRVEGNWSVKDSEEMTLNYELLGNHTAQGAFYGLAGYGAGMWLSGNKTEWGVVGSVIAANIPILIDGRYKTPEVLIGRNIGALGFSLGATFYIEMTRRGRLNYTLIPAFQRR